MAKQTLKQFAYVTIKEKILNCEYKPNAFLTEESLCEELNISRTPVRDALGRLEQEQLVRLLPKKGFLVAPLTSQEISMVFEGRMLLEPYVILNYCSNLSEETITNMKHISEQYNQAINENQTHLYYELDNLFHTMILSQCTNRYLLKSYETLKNDDHRLRVLTGSSLNQRLAKTINEHRTILEYLASGNLEQAAESMKVHLTNSKISSFQIL